MLMDVKDPTSDLGKKKLETDLDCGTDSVQPDGGVAKVEGIFGTTNYEGFVPSPSPTLFQELLDPYGARANRKGRIKILRNELKMAKTPEERERISKEIKKAEEELAVINNHIKNLQKPNKVTPKSPRY